MPYVTMNPSVGEEARDVQSPGVLPQSLDESVETQAVGEHSIRDSLIDASYILIDNPSPTEIQMPDLGVTHLISGKPNVDTRAGKAASRTPIIEPTEVWHPRKFNRVPGSRGLLEVGVAPTV